MEPTPPAAPADQRPVPGARRVALIAGGTAGHVYPALTVAGAYRQAVPGAAMLFIGTTSGFESRLVTAHGYRFQPVPGAPLFGVGVAGKALAARRLFQGARQARDLLQSEGIELAIGFGGYASAGAILAARRLGLRTAIVELNAFPGLANRFLGRIVDRAYLGSGVIQSAFASAKTVVSGIPVRPEIVRIGSVRTAGPGVDRRVHVLVTGGSLGSAFLNRRSAELLACLAGHGVALDVRHQAGACDLEMVRGTYARAGLLAAVVPYIENMADAYSWADFAIACAGAGTLAELAAAGLPALLVPLHGASQDHQSANARAFVAASDGLWVCEADWHPTALAAQVARFVTDQDAWAAASHRMRRMATPDAASVIVADCEAMMVASA